MASLPEPNVWRFLNVYQSGFARRSARGEAPPIAWGRDGKLVKGLLSQYGYERLVELLELFFESEDALVKQRGYALSCFPTVLPQLLMGPAPNSSPPRRVQATPVARQGSQAAHWQQGAEIAVSDVSLFERYPQLAHRVRSQPP